MIGNILERFLFEVKITPKNVNNCLAFFLLLSPTEMIFYRYWRRGNYKFTDDLRQSIFIMLLMGLW